MIDKIISALESMQEDMEEHGEVQKARGVSSAIWLIDFMKDFADRKTEPQIVKKYETFCGVPMAKAIKVMQKYKASKADEEESSTCEEAILNARLVGYQDGFKACNKEWFLRLGIKTQYDEPQTDSEFPNNCEDEPQTGADCNKCLGELCSFSECPMETEPQTDCAWK